MKKHIPILLIIISLLLLGAFQGFWLYKTYQEQKDLLYKQTDNLFQTTLNAQQDSLISKSFGNSLSNIGMVLDKAVGKSKPKTKPKSKLKFKVSVKADSLSLAQQFKNSDFKITDLSISISGDDPKEMKETGKLVTFFLKSMKEKNAKDSTQKNGPSRAVFMMRTDSFSVAKLNDSVKNRVSFIKMNDSTRRQFDPKRPVFIFTGKPKSKPTSAKIDQLIKKDNRPSVTWSEAGKAGKGSEIVVKRKAFMGKKDFKFTLNDMDLNPDSLGLAYQKELQKASISLPFVIKKINTTTKESPSEHLATKIAYAGIPLVGFQAVFEGENLYLFKKLATQGLFSLLLLGIVAFSFSLIYNNLQQQKRLTILKNDFISNITHELKTPITTVGVAIEALGNFNVLANPIQTKEYLEISKSELNRLSLLVDRVLKMAVFEQTKPALHLEQFDLAEQINQVMDSMKLQFEKYKANVAFEHQNQTYLLLADRIHITNILYNLMDNALKYSQNQPQINVHLSQNQGQICLNIQDQGIGIDPVYETKVFEKFFRIPTGNTHNVKGHGLGLSYVADVVKQHGGQINLYSQLGKGTRFELIFEKQ